MCEISLSQNTCVLLHAHGLTSHRARSTAISIVFSIAALELESDLLYSHPTLIDSQLVIRLTVNSFLIDRSCGMSGIVHISASN